MVEKATVAEKQLVVFNLGSEVYAVDIGMVREIIQLQPVTRVPGTSDSVEGVINLRGTVIPVVDLRKRFQLPKVEKTKDTRIVVLSCREMEVGVIVDSVAEVLRIPVDAIEPASSLFTNGNLEHLLGIVKLTGKLIIMLNMEKILSTQDIATVNAIDMMKNNKNSQTKKEPASV
jgi:purine-binding chemotaxis protein CheW